MNKKLFLHVGLNKTGSSALQSWLSNNNEELSQSDYHYPVTENKSAKFEISSGNGTMFDGYLDGTIGQEKIIENYFDTTLSNIIISKENFNFTEKKIKNLKSFCSQHSLDLKVIVYVRDIYGWAYSIYVQVVKRHSYVKGFDAFARSLKSAMHIEYASLIYENIENVDIVHYDIVKADVAAAFSASINLDYHQLKPMANVKVNRTLTFEEINVVTFISSLAGIYNPRNNNDDVCKLASDFLVNTYKERVSEVFVDESLVSLLEKKFKDDVITFNNKTGVDLKLFTEDIRANTVKLNYLNNDILLDVMNNIWERIDAKWASYLAAEVYMISATHGSKLIFDIMGKKNKYIVAHLLRDTALFLESTDLDKSLAFMTMAQKIKPSGKFIKKKVAEITEKLSS